MMNTPDIACGKTHFFNCLKPSVLLPAVCAMMLQTWRLLQRGMLFSYSSARMFSAVVVITGLWATFCRYRHKHTNWSVVSGCVRFTLPSREKRLAVSGIVSIGLGSSWWRRLFGCVRVKLYCEGRKRAWISVLLNQEEADAMVSALMNSFSKNEECRAGYFRQGRYSAAICALTSKRPLLMLIASTLLTVFSGGRTAMDLSADALLLLATAEMIWNAARFRKMSISSDASGYKVKSGFFGNQTTIVPAEAAAGICVRYSPLGALCGAGSMELLCRGGRRVPLARWMEEDGQRKAALSLLGMTDNKGSLFSDPDGLRRSYFTGFQFCLSFTALAAVIDLTVKPAGGSILAAGVFALCCVGMQCMTGFRLAERSGIEVTPAFLRAGGVKNCGAEMLYLRRSCVDGVRISTPLFSRMNNLCCVTPIASGRSTGVRCVRLSYPAVDGMMRRFV